MVDIDDVDRHMGRADNVVITDQTHAYTGSGFALCEQCGEPRIHSNHRGHDYDVPPGVKPETIAEEASRIVYGDREKAYDDPNQNFRRIAKMWSGVLDKKLAPGCDVTPRDVALMLVMLKVSRESFRPHRDNRVDMVGYTLCLDRIVQEETDKANAAK